MALLNSSWVTRGNSSNFSTADLCAHHDQVKKPHQLKPERSPFTRSQGWPHPFPPHLLRRIADRSRGICPEYGLAAGEP